MAPDSPTTTELLRGLHEQDNHAAWNEFDRRYRPILIAFLRRLGVSEVDADDVAQETLTCFIRDYRANRYDPRQGRLRCWLISIARCRCADLQRAAARRKVGRGESAIAELPDDDTSEAVWEEEQKRVIFEQALGELQHSGHFHERTLEAFDRVVLRHEPVAAVAAELEMTPQEIYNTKNRVIARLRAIAERCEASCVGD